MIFCFLTLHFVTSAAEADFFATAAPVLHLPGEDGSRTILVCVVSDLRDGDVEVLWLSSRTGESRQTGHSLARDEDGSHSATSVISVASHEWESFVCFVSYMGPGNRKSTHYIDVAREDSDTTCLEGQSKVSDVVQTQTDAVVILALRILLVKTTTFNFLLTTQVVMKCRNRNEEQVLAVDLDAVLVHSLVCTVRYSAGA